MECFKCKKEISDDAVFCPFCGEKIERKQVCEKCGKEIEEGAAFCHYCGNEIKIAKKAGQNKPEKKGRYKRMERILTPSLLLGLIVGLFICSFFIGCKTISTISKESVFYDIFWFFGKGFETAKLRAEAASPLEHNYGVLLFIEYLPIIIGVIAIVFNFISMMICSILATVKLTKGLKGEKEINLSSITSVAVISFVLATAITYSTCSYQLFSQSILISNMVLPIGSVLGIVMICVFLIAAFVLKSVAKGKGVANSNWILKIIWNTFTLILSVLILVLLCEAFIDSTSQYYIAKTPSSFIVRDIFERYINSGEEVAKGLWGASVINYFASIAVTLLISIVIMFVIKSFLSDKDYRIHALWFTIANCVCCVILFISAIIISNGYKELSNYTVSITNIVYVFIFALVALVIQITNSITTKPQKLKL